MIYVQCRLEKKVPEGVVETVTWIPKEHASVGKRLKLYNESLGWVDGWLVHGVYGECDEKNLPDHHVDKGGLWRTTSGQTPRGHK